MTNRKQNEISHGYLKGSDLKEREQEVLADASRKTGFVPTQLVGRSAWWGSSEIGAFHYAGTLKGKKAVLKIQGVRPSISEIEMVEAFAKANKSKVIRPPHLYASLPWDEEKRYEALILESIEGSRIVESPTTKDQIKRFFELYRDYQNNCLGSPWVDRPEERVSAVLADRFTKWREMSYKIYPNHPLRKDSDVDLINMAVKKLEQEYQKVEPKFMHGHFSDGDLYQVGDQVVVLSNLYWSWRPPFYDAVFGYHWFMYHLSAVEKISPRKIEEQRNIWLSEIHALPQIQGFEGKKLLNLALLERAAAGLNLDGLSTDPKKPISNYLLETTRDGIGKLLKEINEN